MAQRTSSRLRRQVHAHRDALAQTPGLPFAELLDPELVQQAVRDEQVTFRDRLFSPLVTLWVFLSQVLDPDHSCRQAVARWLAFRAARGLAPCSSDTGAYGKARQRLPEGVLARLARATGQRLHQQAPVEWRWNGRPVKMVDGTTVSMPDTPANQPAYPQPPAQKRGVGFPLARLVVLFSFAVGTVLDAAIGRYQGKETGETALVRALHDQLAAGDLLLADRYYCTYFEIALVRERGGEVVMRLHHRRPVDFRTGRRLGRSDHVVTWTKPPRPAWMDEATYARMPATLLIREVRVRVCRPGYRVRCLVVATTLLDPVQTPALEVALLYRVRWFAELDLRALKETMQMDVLRCPSPAMVRKEIWAHLLAYNLIRGLMTQAALEHHLLPLEISFKGALQTLAAFAPLAWTASADELPALACQLRQALARHRVGNRPGRSEPRARKRRPKHYPLLNEPRTQARLRTTACS